MEKDSAKIRVMIVDDHVLMRMGIVFALNNEPDIEVVAEAGSATEAGIEFDRCRPDLVIVDLRLPDGSGIDLISEFSSKRRSTKVLVFTNYGTGDQMLVALEAGALGLLVKDSPASELIDAVRKVAKGVQCIPANASLRLFSQISTSLSDREIQVLNLIKEGLSNKEIADSLKIVESTVKGHVSALFQKLGVFDRTQAVLTAYKRGLIFID